MVLLQSNQRIICSSVIPPLHQTDTSLVLLTTQKFNQPKDNDKRHLSIPGRGFAQRLNNES